MFKKIIGTVLLVVISLSSYAQTQDSSDINITPQGVLYTVSAHETLSGISLKFTGHFNHWRAIGKLNQIDNDRTIPIGKKILIPAALLAPKAAYARISTFYGKVIIQSSDGNAIEAKIGTLLKEGDTLTTLADGFISLVLDDETQFTLPPDSILTLKLLQTTQFVNAPRTRLVLQQGRVESRVTPLTKPGSKYEVISPSAVSGVRGTNFRVRYDGKKVFNEVITGKVAVNPVNERTGRQEKIVGGGFGAIVENGRAGKPVALLALASMADGYQNQQRLPIQFALSHPAAASFRVIISTDAMAQNSIAEVLVNSVNGEANAKLDNLEDGNYFVHYSAIDAAGLEGVQGTLRFSVNARPFPPFLLQPGAKFQGNAKNGFTPVTMQWSQAGDVSAYRLQIAKDAAFSTDMIESIHQDVSHAVVPLQTGVYYWRVASIIKHDNALKQGPFSDAKKVNVIREPSTPVASISGKELNFAWSTTAGQRFSFQLSDTPSFDKLLVDIETTKPEATMKQPPAGTYYARVRSTDDDGFVGIFSPPQTVVIPAYWQTESGAVLQSQGQALGTGF